MNAPDAEEDPKQGRDWDEVSRHSADSEEEAAQLLAAGDFETFDIDEEAAQSGGGGAATRPQPPLGRVGRGSGGGCLRAVARFLQGARPPRIQKVEPWLPAVQEFPIRCLDRLCTRPWHRGALLVALLLAWALAVAAPLVRAKAGVVDAATGAAVRQLSCTDTLWRRNNECGLDGDDCRPFANTSFAFRCPASCAGVQTLNPHHVGPLDVLYAPLVVGGPVYRGDSFICSAAIHAGVISDSGGACGVVSLLGEYYGFFASEQNGIQSVAFPSYFPLSFSVAADYPDNNSSSSFSSSCAIRDPRRPLLFVSLFFSTLLSLFTTSAPVLFFAEFFGLFAHTALISDPPSLSGPSDTLLPRLVSLCAERLLPAAFCAAVVYWTCARRTLHGLRAQLDKTVLWLGGFWLGALSNDTLGWIPISRLTPHDLAQQPGAKLALAIILAVLVVIVAQQVYYFWLEGRVVPYLALYGVFLATLLAGLALQGLGLGLDLRIHHYVLALLLLPGTSMQTRPALLYQGLLLGLFVNGIASWGFDSVLQTADALRGDALFASAVPQVVEPQVFLPLAGPWSIAFKWLPPPPPPAAVGMLYEGVSVLVNDVERYRRFFAEEPAAEQVFTWTRSNGSSSSSVAAAAESTAPEFFRFAFVRADGSSLDYTEAGTWFANGSWSKGAGYW